MKVHDRRKTEDFQRTAASETLTSNDQQQCLNANPTWIWMAADGTTSDEALHEMQGQRVNSQAVVREELGHASTNAYPRNDAYKHVGRTSCRFTAQVADLRLGYVSR